MSSELHSSTGRVAMDRPREKTRTPRRDLRLLLLLPAALVIIAVAFGIRGDSATIDRDHLQIDTVSRGPLVREISAPGVLAPANMTVISSPVSGRVERRIVEIGDSVDAGEPLFDLSNRDERRELLEIEQERAAAESDLVDLRAALRADELSSANVVRRTEFEARDTARQAEASKRLFAEGLISSLEADRDRDSAAELAERVESERARHSALRASAVAQLESQENQVERMKALESFQRTVVESMLVETPVAGVVREIDVEPGTWVNAGQRLARVVEPGRLEAVLQVAEAGAREIAPGQPVELNARGALLEGTVARIAPAVSGGTVAVEVRLKGELPEGLRPDLSVDATIVVARLDDVLSIGRPSSAHPHGRDDLYRLVGENSMERAGITYGIASADRIEIREGAREGDRFAIAGLEEETRQRVELE